MVRYMVVFVFDFIQVSLARPLARTKLTKCIRSTGNLRSVCPQIDDDVAVVIKSKQSFQGYKLYQ